MLSTTLVNRKHALKVVKELDAFPKVPESYQETSAAGGGLSIVTFILIGILIISEISYYASTELRFDYIVDSNFSAKVQLNIDMTIAMKCHNIGADVLDQTGQDVLGFGQLQEEPVYWELSPNQEEYRQFLRNVNSYLSEEYHALQDFLWKDSSYQLTQAMPKREGADPPGDPDACRVHGSLEVNKVAGNFHITAGKSIPVIPKGHAHLAMMMDVKDYNFSHRIDHFSFGYIVPGIVYPLDGTEIITAFNYHNFQYFMQVVPTEVRTYRTNMDTYQFAVTESNRPINHQEGSHGVPGIFVKYDLSSLMIRVREEHKPYWQFFVRLCGIIGGIFSVSGMLNGIMGFLGDLICCRLKWGDYKSPRYDDAVASLIQTPSSPSSPLVQPGIVDSNINSVNLITSNTFSNSDSHIQGTSSQSASTIPPPSPS